MSGSIAHLSGAGDTRKNSRYEEPLKQFIEAKAQMRTIYNELDECVQTLAKFYNEGEAADKFVPAKEIDEVKRFQDSIGTIQKMFNRDKMKVVFFGRTSNGKSTVINAMLHQKLLPQGMGHTTSNFLKVEGGSENDQFIQIENTDEKLPIEDLPRLGNALNRAHGASQVGTDDLVTVYYPKASSKLLQNEVVLVDSPGVDLSPEYDSWIDKHCLDADVFVLVCNSESTLTQAEKNFFLRVSKKLSRPNVFILNNRWDASSGESEAQIEQVRNQHMQRFTHFLVDELKSCSPQESKNRVFFISAREILEARLKERGQITSAYQQEGHAHRKADFLSFEKSFERIISKAAIRTKFEAHDRRAKEIINDMIDNLDNVTNLANQKHQSLKLDYHLKNKEFNDCRNRFAEFEKKYRDQQQTIRQEVHLKVSADFHFEIEHLEAIIDRFTDHKDFSDSPDKIAEYKYQLANYVEKRVTEDLKNKCSGALMSRIWNLEKELFENVREIIGAEYGKDLETAWRYKHPFEFNITINVPQLVEDFQEDLEFRFSLGPSALIRKVIAYTSGRPMTSIGRDHFAAIVNHRPEHGAMARPNMDPSIPGYSDDAVSRMILNWATYTSNAGVGLIIVSFLVYQNVGWKVIVAGGGTYGGLYLWERFRWNNAAKEQHLKDQFRSHLALKMKQVGAVHTAQCERQVINELENVHKGLKDVVAGVHQQMKLSMDAISKTVTHVEEFLGGITKIKNHSSFINRSLEEFAKKFLLPDSP